MAATRLRGGNAGSARGAAGLVAEAIGVARPAGAAEARGATIRRRLVTVPARLARRARKLTLHLPEHWPWVDA